MFLILAILFNGRQRMISEAAKKLHKSEVERSVSRLVTQCLCFWFNVDYCYSWFSDLSSLAFSLACV